MSIARHDFPTKEALADALAGHVADALTARLSRSGRAALAVSGGRTPTRFFEALSKKPVEWTRIDVTLVDERWVGEDSDRSNAALVRAHLLQGPAAAAGFVPLHVDVPTPEDGLAQVTARIAALPLPFAAAVLGMGDDGHTASFFPGGDRLARAMDPAPGQLLETMRAPAAGEPRITLTLPVLLAAETLCLHIEGAGKQRVLEAALVCGPAEAMPIRAVLTRSERPVEIFWCP
ncbi:6-phosphogluconolactonase [Inquilinus sp. Marseille-Q2685]|uniref:6-phosphogluconolactonase n=1 Tax=Inquilinus sp. Marseille-Q2685 TaxID=2866581 RepID=UPI001CE40289|nr:6-phosphogluconolactonase [Inquilinus sp. Marseille-Q2685]